MNVFPHVLISQLVDGSCVWTGAVRTMEVLDRGRINATKHGRGVPVNDLC